MGRNRAKPVPVTASRSSLSERTTTHTSLVVSAKLCIVLQQLTMACLVLVACAFTSDTMIEVVTARMAYAFEPTHVHDDASVRHFDPVCANFF
jgi:hypothetical protein